MKDELEQTDVPEDKRPIPILGIQFSERDWTEDFTHENGNYLCKCSICKKDFYGHKRRPICKVCSIPTDLPTHTDFYEEYHKKPQDKFLGIVPTKSISLPSDDIILKEFTNDFGSHSTTSLKYRWQGVIWLLEKIKSQSIHYG